MTSGGDDAPAPGEVPLAGPGEPGPIPTSTVPPQFDLSSGELPKGDKDRIDEELTSNRHRRYMQWLAFIALGAVCIAFMIVLIVALHRMFTDKETLAVLTQARDWHTLTLLGIALVVFAIVPLSIALALVKMVAYTSKESKEELALTTPQLELVKVIVEAAKAIKG